MGDILGPRNHADVAAAILKPFVSEQNHWMVEKHAIFQGYYFFHHLGLDRNMREEFRDHPWYAVTEEFCRRERIPVPQFSPEALALLLGYEFPGNVRELQNLVEGAVSLSDGVVDLDLARSLLSEPARPTSPEALDLETAERQHIAKVLKLAGGNKSRAARILGVDRRTLQRKGF